VAAVGSIVVCCFSAWAGGQPPLTPDGVWKMRYDAKLDGQVLAEAKGDVGEVRWRCAVRNNRVSGSLAGLKENDPSDHRLAGEIVDGKPAILFLRQDGPRGLVCFYTGKRSESGSFVGTWFDNRGKSGDFELVIEPK
jgi:hypothetical protein